jgi:hypothetical protein
MSVSYKKYIFPEVDKSAGKPLSKVSNLQTELVKSIGGYLSSEKVQPDQNIALPGMSKANDIWKAAIKDAGKNELTVKGGVDSKGDLVVSITGVLPDSKGKGAPYEKVAIVRAGFGKLIEEIKTEAHALVNLEKGDSTIDDSTDRQEKGLGVKAQLPGSTDFGQIKTGNVILNAHGTPVKVSGVLLGQKLGNRTPEQIIKLLTESSDAKKALSKEFSGTVVLSGCYTASGNGTAPPGYDYAAFAGKVLTLLRAKGYKKCNVKGMPGELVVRGDGKTMAVDHDTTLDAQDDDNLVDNLSGTFGAKKR